MVKHTTLQQVASIISTRLPLDKFQQVFLFGKWLAVRRDIEEPAEGNILREQSYRKKPNRYN